MADVKDGGDFYVPKSVDTLEDNVDMGEYVCAVSAGVATGRVTSARGTFKGQRSYSLVKYDQPQRLVAHV